jgi:hypothetical protein
VLAQLREGLRVVGHALKANIVGPRRYDGDAERICETIVEQCWDERRGRYRTSLHNYPIFYARDFGMCIDALLALGHRDRVQRTLAYALACYARKGRVTQQISPGGEPFNFPSCESPDALAFLLYSLASLNDKALIKRHKSFLEQELRRFAGAVIDKRTGLVRRHLRVAGMRDYALRDSSCYDNAMVAAVKKYAAELNLKHPLSRYDYKKLLITTFWAGNYFKDDRANGVITGDANVAPFWLGVLGEKEERDRFPQVLAALQAARLDQPYPLRYESGYATTRMSWLDVAMGGWERDTVWLHLGNMFVQVVARHDRAQARAYLGGFTELIERERNYPEVLTAEGRPHRSVFFHGDDSMLWAANYLALRQQLR